MNTKPDVYSAEEEIKNVLDGFASTSPAVDVTLTRAEGWKIRAIIVGLARASGFFNAFSQSTLDAISTGTVDAAALYRKALALNEPDVEKAAPAPTGGTTTEPFFAWEHVVESGRPVDTGKRTAHGHRIISNRGHEAIEFPWNSGQLIGPEIYESSLSDKRKAAAPDLLSTLKAWMAFAEEVGLSDSDLYRATARTIANAQGM